MNEKKTNEKKALKKALKIIAIVFVFVILLAVILYSVSYFLGKKGSQTDSLPVSAFYEANYDEDIFENTAYLQMDRSIFYMNYGSGVRLTEDNYESAGIASAFFYEYFDHIIRGECDAYRSMLTQHYIDTFSPPELFTMQMLYDIEVDQVQTTSTAKYNGQDVTMYYFSVKYKIFRNNGTFRNDVASNAAKMQYYELYSYNGTFYLNAVSNKHVIVAGAEE